MFHPGQCLDNPSPSLSWLQFRVENRHCNHSVQVLPISEYLGYYGICKTRVKSVTETLSAGLFHSKLLSLPAFLIRGKI